MLLISPTAVSPKWNPSPKDETPPTEHTQPQQVYKVLYTFVNLSFDFGKLSRRSLKLKA